MTHTRMSHKDLGEMIIALLDNIDQSDLPDYELIFREKWDWGDVKGSISEAIEIELIEDFNYVLEVSLSTSCIYTLNIHDEQDVGLGGIGELDEVENIEYEINEILFKYGEDEINFSGSRVLKDKIINILNEII